MNLSNLKIIWEWLTKLSPDFLRFFVIFLMGIILFQCNKDGIADMFRQEIQRETKAKQDREQYTIEITPRVHDILEDILTQDEKATNVLLLNYHNTLTSSHGLSYRYLTGLCESFQESSPCIDYWKELDYMNYGEEIQKITMRRCLLMHNVQMFREEYPKFTYLLERSNAASAVFYPIIGVDGSLGMLVVLYKQELSELTLDNIRKAIAPNIQPLAVLLDYNYVSGIEEL